MVTYALLLSSTLQTETAEGIIKATGKSLPVNPPSYGHICKRINKLNVNINNHDRKDDDYYYYIIVAADSTGIKVTNRVVSG